MSEPRPKSHRERAEQAVLKMGAARGWLLPEKVNVIAEGTFPTELVEALKTYADMCPDCDGTGIRRDWDGDPEQCQWCFEAHGALALYEPEEG